jgi:site-specific DNA-cytosine methylase
MKVLFACEESQIGCRAFRARGHEAYSCDIIECSGGHPEWHIKDDIRNVLHHETVRPEWDMVIAFPPCTDLAVSGARWFKEKQADGRQQASIALFEFFTHLKTPFWAIENPVGIMSSIYRKPDQIIHPWQFGHGETKATCLWLKNLPLLVPTNIVEGREHRIWKMAPGPDRAKKRSESYLGIMEAMANQWG